MMGWGACGYRFRFIALAVLASLLVLGACTGPSSLAGDEPVATPTAAHEATPEPAAQADASTATASPPLEPSPTATTTPVPTETLAPTATATAEPEPTPTEPPTSTPRPTSTPPETDPTATPETDAQATFDVEAFQQQAGELLEDEEGIYGISVRLPDGTVVFEMNPDESMEAASLYKLAIMVEAFRQRESGGLSFDDEWMMYPAYFKYVESDDPYDESYEGQTVPLGDLLYAMVTRSSNTAAWALLDRVTNSRANATMQELGLTGTEIRWMPAHDQAAFAPSAEPGRDLLTQRADEAWQVTTAGDMARLFTLLLNGQAVSPDADREMLEMLAEQTINDRLPAYLPAGTVVAHKTGNLDGLVHDAGVIYTPSGPVVIAVLSEDAPNAWHVTAELGFIAYQAGS